MLFGFIIFQLLLLIVIFGGGYSKLFLERFREVVWVGESGFIGGFRHIVTLGEQCAGMGEAFLSDVVAGGNVEQGFHLHVQQTTADA